MQLHTIPLVLGLIVGVVILIGLLSGGSNPPNKLLFHSNKANSEAHMTLSLNNSALKLKDCLLTCQ